MDKDYSLTASDFVVGEPQIGQVLKEANVNLEYKVQSLLKKDSLEITDADRKAIVEAVSKSPHRLIVITHGTDTIIDTAKALAEIADKTIVLTGAMQPAAFKITDAIFNIGCAVSAVQLLQNGVHIVMNGRIYPWNKTRKDMTKSQFVDD